MVREDIRRARSLGIAGIILCLIAFVLITFTLLLHSTPTQISQENVSAPQEGEENITIAEIQNKTQPLSQELNKPLLYILHRDTGNFSIVDVEKKEVINTLAVGKFPQEMFYDKLTNAMYITNQISDSISVIDLAAEKVIQTIDAGKSPQGIAVIKNKVYVANLLENKVLVINKELGYIEKEINVGKAPSQIILSEDQRKIYVLNKDSGDITVISTDIDATVDVWYAGDKPERFAFSPYEKFIYVTSLNGLITILPLKHPKEYSEVRAGLGSSAIAFTPNNILSAVVNSDDNTVSLISIANDLLLGTIEVGVNPSDIAITKDGKLAYIVNADSNTISILDLQQKTRTAEFSVGKDPRKIMLREE